jgi:hypothetical protein
MKPLFIRVVFITAIVSVASIVAFEGAQSRPDTSRMSCAAARALITKQGAIVLGTGPSIFDRYVSSRAHCLSTQITEPAFVATTDDRQCFAGYTCREAVYGDR